MRLKKGCTENERHILCSVIFSEDLSDCDIMGKKCGTARQSADDNKIRRMRTARWII